MLTTELHCFEKFPQLFSYSPHFLHTYFSRDAATSVAELFTRGWKGNNFDLPSNFANSYDVASVASSKEVAGVETAVRRGLQKGLSERNERSNDGVIFRDDASDFDLTTITEDVLTNTSGVTGDNHAPKREGRKKNDGMKKKMKTLENLSKDLSHEAWMCGVCGKSFSSLDAADKHEDQHIMDVVAGLGFGGDSSLGSGESITSSKLGTLPRRNLFDANRAVTDNNNRSISGSDPTALDPVQHMHSAPAAVDPLLGYDDQDESLLLSNTVKQGIVLLADEGLVNVCNKAEKLFLTEAENEAEWELELLSRDKAFYDLIAERTLTRQRNPTSRFRSEGKNVLSKVQNKLVDAYQLCKEGDKGGAADQYNKKRTGQEETDHVIVHDETTLYVNVMVKVIITR